MKPTRRTILASPLLAFVKPEPLSPAIVWPTADLSLLLGIEPYDGETDDAFRARVAARWQVRP